MVLTQYARMDNRVADNGIGVVHVSIDFNTRKETQGLVKRFGMHTPMANKPLLNYLGCIRRVTYGYENSLMRTT